MTLVSMADLGDGKKLLGGLNNSTKVLDIVDAGLDSIGVLFTSLVQNVLDLVVLPLGPRLEHRSTIMSDGPENAEKRESYDGFLVDDVNLVADRGNGETGTGGEDGGLRSKTATG